ncbi:MAG TPA: hypothetical protein VFN51_01445 [Candidatus Saccharimonadales bacterium]|nr:hypothetical protein [Candidatus Saccharimonadales bacterium]
MRKQVNKLGLVGSVVALVVVGSSSVLALPAQAHAHALGTENTPTGSNTTGSTAATVHQPTQAASAQANAQANGQAHLAAAQLRSCQNREKAINNIISNIDTRAQNQLTLFGTIATRVENFYVSKGKTVSNYDQLVADIATAKTQAETDFGTVQNTSSFSCTSSNPKATVTAFQSYLKTEISDLQNYRTAVKNLIVAVASANGVNVSSSTSTSSTQGGQ